MKVIRKKLADAVRMLSVDAVQKANSGHPGMPMGMADIAEVLWRDFLNHSPCNPLWPDRDRFVLSNGHGSMLLYSLLHLTGYNVSINDLKNFRQIDSITPGHPEVGCTEGIETTTGPLGQGLANAVGMAIAEKTLAAQFNRPGFSIIDHFTYAFVGDGCMMEGISHEVCSLAGTLQLGKLIVFYDDNGISIDGHIHQWFTDDTKKRFESYGWHVIHANGHDSNSIKQSIEISCKKINQPSLIVCKTIIGFGSPNKAGSHESHGAPLGTEEVLATRKCLSWEHEAFYIPDEIYQLWDCRKKGSKKEQSWKRKFAAYKEKFPIDAREFMRRIKGKLPDVFNLKTQEWIEKLQKHANNIATRKSSQNTIEFFGKYLPEFLGGSADLAPSNLTLWSGARSIVKDSAGNYIHYGVREFGMTAIANGISLHGGFLPYTGTFLIFSDYARNAIRMTSLMRKRHIMVYTHDSIGLGEDGPTHQPIEHISSLRMIPNLSVWRPCDQVESAVAWKYGVERNNGPTAIVLSRQNLPQQKRDKNQLFNILRGGYILKDCNGEPQLIIIATGSEVSLANGAWEILSKDSFKVRVVSMPSTDVFEKQDSEYQNSVIPKNVSKRIAVEAGIQDFWYKYVGLNGVVMGMTTFGDSAPASKLFKKFNFNVDKIVLTSKKLIQSTV